VRDMEGSRIASRVLLQAALLAAVLLLPSARAITCEADAAQIIRVAGEGKQSDNRPTKEKCKRAPGARTPAPKGCPDGGERLPQDNKRSPLDDAPPLTPLVA
jgi:hypothetical protein